MKITVVGCGNAFSNHNFNQSFLLEENGEKFLVDCGGRVPMALAYHGIPLKTIDAIYVSHAHGDHCGGLEEFAFQRYDWMNRPTHFSQGKYAPKLYANNILMKELWEHTLSGGLKSMEGFDATLETFFDVRAIEPNQSFEWQGWKFDLIQQIHIMTGTMVMSTFGLFVSKPGSKSVYFTTDCQYFQPKQIRVFYDKADLIFQDCECTGVDTKNKLFKFGSGVHASAAELFGWPSANATVMGAESRKKIWFSHYQDFVMDDVDFFNNPCDWNALAIEEGFQGFLKIGQVFEV
jgi:ribonuclease BN (tRNA processing enzyme)